MSHQNRNSGQGTSPLVLSKVSYGQTMGLLTSGHNNGQRTGWGGCGIKKIFFEFLSSEKSGCGDADFKSNLTESKHHFCQLLVVQIWVSVSLIWKIGLL